MLLNGDESLADGGQFSLAFVTDDTVRFVGLKVTSPDAIDFRGVLDCSED